MVKKENQLENLGGNCAGELEVELGEIFVGVELATAVGEVDVEVGLAAAAA